MLVLQCNGCADVTCATGQNLAYFGNVSISRLLPYLFGEGTKPIHAKCIHAYMRRATELANSVSRRDTPVVSTVPYSRGKRSLSWCRCTCKYVYGAQTNHRMANNRRFLTIRIPSKDIASVVTRKLIARLAHNLFGTLPMVYLRTTR